MVELFGKKYACEPCIKGHRTTGCRHADRPLVEVRRKGRPTTQCGHCRELRKVKQVTIHCRCVKEGETADGGKCCCGKDRRCACWSPRKSNPKGKKARDGDPSADGGPDSAGGSNSRASPGNLQDTQPPSGAAPTSAVDSSTRPRGEHSTSTVPARSHEHAYSPYGQAYERERASTASAASAPEPLPFPASFASTASQSPTSIPPSAAEDIFADLLASVSSRDGTPSSLSSAPPFPNADNQLPAPDSQPSLKIECDEGGCGEFCSCPHEPTPAEPFPTCKKPSACTTACLSCFIMTVPPEDCLATGNLLSDTSNMVNNGAAGSSATWDTSGIWGAPDEASRESAVMEQRMQNLFKDISAANGAGDFGGDLYGFDTTTTSGELSSDFLQSMPETWN